MNFFVNIIQVFLLGLTIRTEAQAVNLNCNFIFIRGFYTCELRAVNVPDNENVTFVIGGQHQPGWNNAMVQRVQVVAFILPVMIEQFAITFPNLDEYSITSSILNRVQPRAFANNNAPISRDMVEHATNKHNRTRVRRNFKFSGIGFIRK